MLPASSLTCGCWPVTWANSDASLVSISSRLRIPPVQSGLPPSYGSCLSPCFRPCSLQGPEQIQVEVLNSPMVLTSLTAIHWARPPDTALWKYNVFFEVAKGLEDSGVAGCWGCWKLGKQGADLYLRVESSYFNCSWKCHSRQFKICCIFYL